MRIGSVLLLASVVAMAGSGGGPAVYVIGNIDGVSPGADGILALEQDSAVFRSGKTEWSVAYRDIHDVELGTKVMPPSGVPFYKVWQLHKRFGAERAMHRMVNFDFKDKAGKDQTMTLELDESAANETVAEIEMRQGKRTWPRRATNADSWWGDSVWKTTRNNNSVTADTLGSAAVK